MSLQRKRADWRPPKMPHNDGMRRAIERKGYLILVSRTAVCDDPKVWRYEVCANLNDLLEGPVTQHVTVSGPILKDVWYAVHTAVVLLETGYPVGVEKEK